MTQSARVVLHSKAEYDYNTPSKSIMTMELRYPKCIHAELMTHRVFSRNASSSRAIPVNRLIGDIIHNPYVPVHWGKNQPGMQANEECNAPVTHPFTGEIMSREDAWLTAIGNRVRWAEAFNNAGYAKQIVNRLIENDGHIKVLVTSTEWSNFYKLRRHRDAQPEMQDLANKMCEAHRYSEPQSRIHDQWHLPYFHVSEFQDLRAFLPEGNTISQAVLNSTAARISSARCARVSYNLHDGTAPTIEADLKLFERLARADPMHASPMEHQALPDVVTGLRKYGKPTKWRNPELHGNFEGWIQFRKILENGAL